MADTLQTLTSSRIASFKRCRRADWYRYEKGLRPLAESFALNYGSAFHECVETLEMHGLDAAIGRISNTSWSDLYTPHTLAAQIRAYAWRWQDDPIETVWPEQVFNLPLDNPTGGRSKTWERAGKIDARGRYRGTEKPIIRETKTISEDPMSERYWRRLLIDPQVSFYFAAARDLGMDIDEVLYDVVRKPCIAPKMATPVEDRKYKKDGTLYANQRELDETPEEWQWRLFNDMVERPDFYLQRRLVPRLEADLDESRQEVWDVAKDIRQAQLTNHWYRNAGKWACDNCPYFGPCTGMEHIDLNCPPEGWQIVENKHPELES